MSNTYTWEFPAFDCYPEYESHADVVFTIHWRCTADDGNGHMATIYSTQAVIQGPNDPFTPYNEITPEQAKAWVQAAMGIDQVTALQESLDQQIEDLINPKAVTLPAPWANPV